MYFSKDVDEFDACTPTDSVRHIEQICCGNAQSPTQETSEIKDTSLYDTEFMGSKLHGRAGIIHV